MRCCRGSSYLDAALNTDRNPVELDAAVVLARWSLWAVLFVLAKPQIVAIGLLLMFFALRLGRSARTAAAIGASAILAAAAFSYTTTPAELKKVCAYNLIFLAIVPESRNPGADLQALGLDPALKDYARTGLWSAQTVYPQLVSSGVLGEKITQGTLARFVCLIALLPLPAPSSAARSRRTPGGTGLALLPEQAAAATRTFVAGGQISNRSLPMIIRPLYVLRTASIHI